MRVTPVLHQPLHPTPGGCQDAKAWQQRLGKDWGEQGVLPSPSSAGNVSAGIVPNSLCPVKHFAFKLAWQGKDGIGRGRTQQPSLFLGITSA